jgi:hypothetical protein
MEKLDLLIPFEFAALHYTFIFFPYKTVLLSAYCWMMFQVDLKDAEGGRREKVAFCKKPKTLAVRHTGMSKANQTCLEV